MVSRLSAIASGADAWLTSTQLKLSPRARASSHSLAAQALATSTSSNSSTRSLPNKTPKPALDRATIMII